MCNNNTSNSVGVGEVANASGVVDDHDYEISSLRKVKKQRIPKRGPGVAELEKILLEQKKKDGHVEKGKIIGGISSSLVPSLPNTYPLHSSFASSSKSLQRNVTFIPDHIHLGNSTRSSTSHLPPVSTLHVNGNGDLKGSLQLGFGDVGGNGRTKGVYISGSGVFLPEEALLPITWGSCETRKGEEAPKMATDFSFPILVSNGTDHTKMFPPPMVQKNPCHPSMMIGAKRSRPNFPVYNWPPAPPHMPCQPPPFHPHISRLDPSSFPSNNAVFNPGTASGLAPRPDFFIGSSFSLVILGDFGLYFCFWTFSFIRDPMPGSPLEPNVKPCVNNHGNPSGNGSALITFGSPTTPFLSTQNCQPDFSKFIKQFPFQEIKESTGGLLQRSSSGLEVSVHKSSFFSFLLQPEEQRAAAEATLGLKNIEKCTEKTGEFIDLNLKL
ncbi:hypothetical protein CRYUN_Cryun31cG0035900 [Craigia yunnanensis]